MNIVTLLLFGCLGLALLLFLQYHLYALNKSSASNRNERRILILGLPKSGKTYLWQRLTSNAKPRPTVTSLEPNDGIFIPTIREYDVLSPAERQDLFGKIHINDLPGRFDQQVSIIETEISKSTGFIFVIDSGDTENIRAASSFLYNILSSKAYQMKPKAVCLFFNRQGEPGARHKNLLREDLEREVEKSKRLAENYQLPKADIPVTPSLWMSMLSKILPRRFILPQKKSSEEERQTITLTKTPAPMFRLNNLNSPYFLLVQDGAFDLSLEKIKGFVQRAAMLS